MAKKPGERLLRRQYKASKGLQRWRKSWAGGQQWDWQECGGLGTVPRRKERSR